MPIITFESVSKEFTPESYGIKDVSFAVEPGEMIFITGHSGSGKTTLMRLLTKEYTPSGGEIFFQNEPLSTINKHTVHTHRRRIGVVFQDYQLVPEMNVWENIALPLYVMGKKESEIEQRVTDLLNLIKLPHKADDFPSQLSGGEAQRVSIARALAVGPEVIFADEPTGNLDSDTSLAIARLLKKINELGTTVLIATHDLEILDENKALRHIILEKGKLIKDTAAKGGSKANTKSETPKEDASDKAKETKKTSESEEKKSETKVEEKVKEKTDSKPETKEEKKKSSGWGSWFGKKSKETEKKDSEEKPTDTKKETPEKKDDKKKATEEKKKS